MVEDVMDTAVQPIHVNLTDSDVAQLFSTTRLGLSPRG